MKLFNDEIVVSPEDEIRTILETFCVPEEEKGKKLEVVKLSKRALSSLYFRAGRRELCLLLHKFADKFLLNEELKTKKVAYKLNGRIHQRTEAYPYYVIGLPLQLIGRINKIFKRIEKLYNVSLTPRTLEQDDLNKLF